VAGNLVRQLDYDQLANLVDPFGMRSVDLVTRYWTPVEKNSTTLPVMGFVGQNRLLWSVLGALMLAAAFRFVRLEKHATVGSRKKQKSDTAQFAPPVRSRTMARSYEPTPAFAGWWSVARFHAQSLLRSTPFLAIATIGFINVLMNAWYADSNGQNRSWPMSWIMAEASIGGA
jgi:hypothetical protein